MKFNQHWNDFLMMTPKEMVYLQIASQETPYIDYEILLDTGTSAVARPDAFYRAPAWQDAPAQQIVHK